MQLDKICGPVNSVDKNRIVHKIMRLGAVHYYVMSAGGGGVGRYNT